MVTRNEKCLGFAMKNILATTILAVATLIPLSPAAADSPVVLKYNRNQAEELWQNRIQQFLKKGVIPLIDLQSSLDSASGARYLKKSLPTMDRLGIALIAFDGYQAPKASKKKKKKKKKKKGYRWGYYVHSIVNAHPDRFILATNGGTNPNWVKGKGGTERHFIDQTEQHVRTGSYPIMGEFEFRHYLSKSQCKKGRHERDVSVPIDGDNSRRLFQLSSETGVPFIIHHEPEDKLVAALENMLGTYPNAKVIWAHFGQIRKPHLAKSFSPDVVQRLLTTYPNLFFDLATGQPNRSYPCSKLKADTVIWDRGSKGQTKRLHPGYRDLLAKFSDRFVVGFDYGKSRRPLSTHLKNRTANIRLILSQLPTESQHNIAYRNAWKLLTGRPWHP
jgi:hypothetical protein